MCPGRVLGSGCWSVGPSWECLPQWRAHRPGISPRPQRRPWCPVVATPPHTHTETRSYSVVRRGQARGSTVTLVTNDILSLGSRTDGSRSRGTGPRPALRQPAQLGALGAAWQLGAITGPPGCLLSWEPSERPGRRHRICPFSGDIPAAGLSPPLGPGKGQEAERWEEVGSGLPLVHSSAPVCGSLFRGEGGRRG